MACYGKEMCSDVYLDELADASPSEAERNMRMLASVLSRRAYDLGALYLPDEVKFGLGAFIQVCSAVPPPTFFRPMRVKRMPFRRRWKMRRNPSGRLGTTFRQAPEDSAASAAESGADSQNSVDKSFSLCYTIFIQI